MVGKVLPAMERRERAAARGLKQREMHIVDVEVQNVELVGALAHLVQHDHVVGKRVANVGIEAQRAGGAGNQFSGSDGIFARKQCYLMPCRTSSSVR
jgi:hypothetical protein